MDIFKVIMQKDAKNHFGELILKAIEQYHAQFDITPEQIYNIVTEARKKYPNYENINGEISNEIRKLLKPVK